MKLKLNKETLSNLSCATTVGTDDCRSAITACRACPPSAKQLCGRVEKNLSWYDDHCADVGSCCQNCKSHCANC
jgi:hypothetical protein